MSYTIHWLAPERVLLVTVNGDILADEALRLDVEVIAQCRSTPRTLYVLLDMTGARSLPALFTLLNTRAYREPNVGWWVVYGSGNTLVRTLILVTASTLRLKLRLLKDRTGALRFLNIIDRTLPPLDGAAR
ncbi:MAG: hypothetical protein MUE40_21115 [Anaerolineae bacterium]|jgi:hypothetical protein|nr:hypothetical protein [Anaerolineae bacterium]